MIVKFNSTEEFCEELRKDAFKVDRGIVRVTNLFRVSGLSPSIRHLIVVATYSAEGQVVKLERYCGDIWGINKEADDKVLSKAQAFHDFIISTCQELCLELRAGTLEEGER